MFEVSTRGEIIIGMRIATVIRFDEVISIRSKIKRIGISLANDNGLYQTNGRFRETQNEVLNWMITKRDTEK